MDNGRNIMGNPFGIMPELEAEREPPKKKIEAKPSKSVKKTAVREPKKTVLIEPSGKYTAKELRRGFELSIIIGEPRSKSGYRFKK